MLNYNKIQSDINKRNIHLTEIARFGNLKYSSFRDRYTEEKLYANEIEVIAQFFERSIDYYFDREEKQAKVYKTESASVDVIEDPEEKYCKGCEELRRFSQMQEDIITTQSGNIEDLREHIETLKSTFGLGKNLKSGLG